MQNAEWESPMDVTEAYLLEFHKKGGGRGIGLNTELIDNE